MSWCATTQLAQSSEGQEKQFATAGEEDLQPVQWRVILVGSSSPGGDIRRDPVVKSPSSSLELLTAGPSAEDSPDPESCSISDPLEDLADLLESVVDVVDMFEFELDRDFSLPMLFPELLESLLAS